MTTEEFSELRKELIKKCVNLTESKGKDYTKGNTNVLINFIEGADHFDVPVRKYLGFALKKQVDAIYNYIKTDGESQSEPIESRITDAINYLIFLNALNKYIDKQSE
jgi:hypothetical protein